jgi:hypothetical protein
LPAHGALRLDALLNASPVEVVTTGQFDAHDGVVHGFHADSTFFFGLAAVKVPLAEEQVIVEMIGGGPTNLALGGDIGARLRHHLSLALR